MNQFEDGLSKIEYTELCKTVRKHISEDIRYFNCSLVRETIEKNKGMKKMKHRLVIGKNQMIAIRKPDCSVVRNKNEIVEVVAEF